MVGDRESENSEVLLLSVSAGESDGVSKATP